MEINLKTIHQDMLSLRKDIELIKKAIIQEEELTDWAEQELAEARKRTDNISHEEVKKLIIEK